MARAVFCIASTEDQAEIMVKHLKRNGFRDADISVLFPDRTGAKDFAHEQHTKAPEGAVIGAVALGVVGACLGWLLGFGYLHIAELAAFAAGGPIMAGLSAAAVGIVIGGVIGAVVGSGIPEFVAKRYTGKIGAGNILISVHAETFQLARTAKQIFSDAGCGRAQIGSECSAPSRFQERLA